MFGVVRLVDRVSIVCSEAYNHENGGLVDIDWRSLRLALQFGILVQEYCQFSMLGGCLRS
jgi:hypothetical protein